jgi:hypothetical protein
MKLLLIFLAFSSHQVLALEAVVTVLETPLFKFRSYESPVVKQLRKGDVIKIHPSVGNDMTIEQYAPSPEKLKNLTEKLRTSPEYKADPIFRGEAENTYYLEDEFIATIDRQGQIAFVLSDHIHIYFNDSREFVQSPLGKDPTDYRLEEPLPEKYPLKVPTGYRGQFVLGFTQPFSENYPYKESIKTKGYSSPIDMSYTVLKIAPGNYQERLFIGASFNFRYYENSYSFANFRLSKEKSARIGLGPSISYDAYKGVKDRINLMGVILLNFFDQLYITQSSPSKKDARSYYGQSLAPRFSIQYHRKGILEDIDLILGTTMEVGSATIFRAKTAGKEPSWWQNAGNDKFTSRTTFTLGGYVGFQSAY